MELGQVKADLEAYGVRKTGILLKKMLDEINQR